MTETSNKNGRVALIVVSDTHENHVYGLGPPTFTRSDGDTVRANGVRRELWYLWEKFWDDTLKMTEGYTRVGVALGDIIENDEKVRSKTELVTHSPADAHRMVCETWEPLADELDHMLFLRGTEAHTGSNAWHEEAVAANFDNSIRDEQHEAASWWHFYGEFGGVVFDLAHHASMGRVHRNIAGAAGRLAYDVQRAYMQDWNQRAPDVVVRAHNHRFADSGTTYTTRAFMIGCFQFKTAYVHRINAGHEMPNLGGLVVLCEGGEYEAHPIRIKPKKKKLWRMKSL